MTKINPTKIIVIVGPTASGKSGLGIKLAKKFNGEIISADSRQVYRGMDIGTGKVSKKEQKIVSHHLIDVASPKKQFTADDFKKLGTAQNLGSNSSYQNDQKSVACGEGKNGNGHKRKDLRKNTILDFIKRHNNVSIKDIAPNIIGCSEKTIQRELIELISKGKITKAGERRWSRYSIA